MPSPVRLGSDVVLCSNRLTGARVGVVCNHASIDRGFLHVIDRVERCEGVTLAAIFGPQHGFRSDVQDNMVETPHGDDARRRVPVYSLYSETREPTAEMLRGVDALIVDLQDIGARIYTYIYTMANCMRAASPLKAILTQFTAAPANDTASPITCRTNHMTQGRPRPIWSRM